MPDQNTFMSGKRRLFRYCLFFSFFIALLALLFTHGLRYGASRWLAAQGADSVRIGWLHFNPLTGFATVEDLLVRKDGEVVLRDEDIDIKISIRDLFSRRLTIEHAGLSGVYVDIRQYEDGGIRIAALRPGGEEDEPPPDQAQESAGDPWIVKVVRLRLQDCMVRFTSPADTYTLRAEDFDIRHLSTAGVEAKNTSMVFRGRLNNAPLQLKIHDSTILPRPAVSGRVDIDGLDLAGFRSAAKGTLEELSGGLSVGGDFVVNLVGENRLESHFKGDVSLRSGRLGLEGLYFTYGDLGWRGRLGFNGRKEESHLDMDGGLSGSDLNLGMAGGDISIHQDELDLETRSALTFSGPAFEISGNTVLEIRGAGVDLGEGRTFSAGRLSWRGDDRYRAGEAGEGSLSGRLEAGDFAMNLAGPELVLELDSLGLDTGTSLKDGENGFRIVGGNDLQISGTSLNLGGDRSFEVDDLSWQGGTEYRQGVQADISLNGTLEGKGFGMKMGGLNLDLHLDDWFLDTETSLLTGENGLGINGTGNLTVSGLDLDVGGAKSLRGTMGRLDLDECRLHSLDDIGAGGLRISDVSVAALEEGGGGSIRNGPFLTIGEGNLEGISWLAGKSVALEEVDLADFFGRLVREKDGGLRVLRILQSLSGEPGQEDRHREVPASDAAGGPDFRLGSLGIGGESRLRFEDYSTAEPFQAGLGIERFAVRDLDSTEPEKPFSFLLRGGLGEHSSLAVNGTCTPFAEEVGLTLNTRLNDYPAAGLSPYAVDLIGYYLSQGHVNIDSRLKLRGDHLESDNQFLFKKLEVKVANREDAAKMTTMLHNISLDQSLSLLRDGNDHIDLDLPVHGSLHDLEVGFDDIAKKVVSKAVIQGAKSYLLNALGPYGTLVSVGLKVGGHLIKVRLPPVTFDPGETALRSEQQGYLQKLAEILYERPELEVAVSGVAVPSEREFIPASPGSEEEARPGRKKAAEKKAQADRDVPLSEKERDYLLDQAGKRAAAVRNYMINEYDIDPGRIFAGESLLDEDRQAEPRVEMGF